MSILGAGLSGLLAFQRAMATTSNNIANSGTEGYSRQRVELADLRPAFLGSSYIGQGVGITGIRRIADEFVTSQLRQSVSTNANALVRAGFAERVDDLLGDATTGLAPAIGRFFDAAQDVAGDPSSTTARTVFLGEAEGLAKQFGAISRRLDEQRQLLNGQLQVGIDEVNEYADSLADLNRQIVSGFSRGASPNQLLDQRDNLLSKLAEKIDLRITEREDRAVNVFIGNGQALVMGGESNRLATIPQEGGAIDLEIGFVGGGNGTPVDITRFMTGGEIGAYLETRDRILDATHNRMGLIAVTLGTLVNQQNGLGLDRDGNLGGAIFEVPAPVVGRYSDNSVSGLPQVSFLTEEISAVTSSDYLLTFAGGNYQLKRLSDDEIVATAPLNGILEADGLSVDTNALGASVGDRWLIQPTRFAAGGLSAVMTDPDGVATMSGALVDPANGGEARLTGLRITADTPATYLPAALVVNDAGDSYNLLGAQYDADAGEATIEGFRVLDPQDPDLFNPTLVIFDATKGQFRVGEERFALDPSGTTTIAANGWELKVRGTPNDGTAFNVDTTPTPVEMPQPATTTIIGPGWELDIRGTPDPHDLFTVDLSRGREGDNRNMLALAGLQRAPVIDGSDTFEGSYNGLLGEVGTQTSQAQIARDASAVLLEASQEQREAISGVNLDEEAANLVRFQQAYQAAAQVIAASNTVFDTLISAVRR